MLNRRWAWVAVLVIGSSMRVHSVPASSTANAEAQTIQGGQNHTVVTLHLPHRMHPRDMNLVESGFTGATTFRESDKIWKLDPENPSVTEILWFNTSDSTWRMRTGQEDLLVPEDYFGEEDRVVVFTRRSVGTWIWTIPSLPDSEQSRDP